MARIKAPVVITANDLLSGEVVYLEALTSMVSRAKGGKSVCDY